ncbi:hypothetical protein BP5796_03595 [Coleophoma crateriformis]|uniref:Heme peroxidase n=1 Tax=Coleophoma crateriformis TaxID=565419 RepID=A0A3D8SNZ6_9HELO|nr:hypothetical protein BP5796_03595 [Coleophoma crateriformis]
MPLVLGQGPLPHLQLSPHLQQLHTIIDKRLPPEVTETRDEGLSKLVGSLSRISVGKNDNTSGKANRATWTDWTLLEMDILDFLKSNKGLIGDVASQGNRVGEDLKLLIDGVHSKAQHQGIDDKQYIMERVIQLAISFPNDSAIQKRLTEFLVKELWDSLEHPPLTYLGDKYEYRCADGSNNYIANPNLGKAGSPYARSVISTTAKRVYPDPSEVFDKLLARTGRPKEHPSRISSTLFYLASIIIHDAFRTGDDSDHPDMNTSSTSSYLDLSPLYGNNEAEQKKVRVMKDGLLKPDTFHEPRLLGFPPGSCAFLVTFNRFHNHVVRELKRLNEAGRFSPNPRLSKDAAEIKMDEDLFQVGRLITCGLYVNIILSDYVRTILNMNYAPDSTWVLDPRDPINSILRDSALPRATGNQVSCEFNLIYRWHSTLSVKDEKWTNEFMEDAFHGKDVSKMSMHEFLQGLHAWKTKILKEKPEARTFGGLTRDKYGFFDTNKLATLLAESTKDVASAFGARQTPVVLKLVSMLGMQQARGWHVGTLNELRKFMKLKPHMSFEDINPDPEIQAAMKSLYKDPDFVELYPGVIFEDSKIPYMPGSGLCGGFTITRAILSDAVALIRSDRFYTVGWTRGSMTDWGFSFINDMTHGTELAGGGKMHLLLETAFPKYYSENSVWKLFPFTHPSEMKRILEMQNLAWKYDFESPLPGGA